MVQGSSALVSCWCQRLTLSLVVREGEAAHSTAQRPSTAAAAGPLLAAGGVVGGAPACRPHPHHLPHYPLLPLWSSPSFIHYTTFSPSHWFLGTPLHRILHFPITHSFIHCNTLTASTFLSCILALSISSSPSLPMTFFSAREKNPSYPRNSQKKKNLARLTYLANSYLSLCFHLALPQRLTLTGLWRSSHTVPTYRNVLPFYVTTDIGSVGVNERGLSFLQSIIFHICSK